MKLLQVGVVVRYIGTRRELHNKIFKIIEVDIYDLDCPYKIKSVDNKGRAVYWATHGNIVKNTGIRRR